MKKVLSAVFIVVFAAAVLCSCKTAPGPEIGTWRMSLNVEETFGAIQAFPAKDLTIDYIVTFKENEEYEMDYDFEKFEKDFKEAAKAADNYAAYKELYEKQIDEYINELKGSAKKAGKYFKEGDYFAILDGTPIFRFRFDGDDLILITEGNTEYTLKRQ